MALSIPYRPGQGPGELCPTAPLIEVFICTIHNGPKAGAGRAPQNHRDWREGVPRKG
jgi:hypothetical protein